MTTTTTEATAGTEQQPAGSDQQPEAPKPGKEPIPAEKFEEALKARLGEQQRKHERELQQLRDDQGKSDTQRIEAERDREKERATAAVQKAAPKVAQALAQVAAITSGGRADRAAAIVRVADLEGVVSFDGDDWTVDETKLGERIGKVLAEYPEWKGDAQTKGAGDGKAGETGQKPPAGKSGGDMGGGGTGLTLEQFQKMSAVERGKLFTEHPDVYRRLADAEIDAKR